MGAPEARVRRKALAIEVRKADNLHFYSLCVAVRHEVFVIEQHCSWGEEYDALEDSCVHFVALVEGEAAGTARWRPYKGGAKIERVAVRAAYRGMGIARVLMEHVMRDIAVDGVSPIILSAQDHAIPFYEKLGFEVFEDGYDEAGIPHHMMQKL